MIEALWYATRSRGRVSGLEFDVSFQAVCYFSALGLVLTALFLI